MRPFSTEVLTILTLISIVWTGLTFTTALIFSVYFIYKSCSRHYGSKPVYPTPTYSAISSALSNHNHLTKTPSLPEHRFKGIDSYEVSKRKYYLSDTAGVMNQNLNIYNNHRKYQQQTYRRDEDDVETTIDRNNRNYSTVRHQLPKPTPNVLVFDRATPYPESILARERLMNQIRFPTKNK